MLSSPFIDLRHPSAFRIRSCRSAVPFALRQQRRPFPVCAQCSQKSWASRVYLRRAASPRRPDAVRRGSSAHWMTFLSRTSHTGSYAARSIGPSDLSMLRTRSKKPVDPSQTANGGAACAYAHKKCRSGSVAKFIRARSLRPRRQNLPPQSVLAPRQRQSFPPRILLLIPAAIFALQTASGSTIFQHTSLHLLRQIHH